MKQTNWNRTIWLTLGAAVVGGVLSLALFGHGFVAAGADETDDAGREGAAGEANAPAHAEGAAAATESGHHAGTHDDGEEEGHGHGHGHGGSDLDRPLAELVAARCEHDVATRDCAECRYEVGFVHVPEDILAAGLIATAPITREAIDDVIVLTGEVGYDERRIAHITPVLEGVVRDVHVGLMDRVEAGQALFTIDSATLGDAQSAWREARAVLRLERRRFRRVKALRDKRIASEREYLAAQSAADQAAIRVEAARDRLLRLGLAEADVAAIREGGARGRMEVRAPLDGRVLDLHLVPGEVVGPDESVLLVGDLGRMWMWVDVYERDLAAVLARLDAGGLEAEVRVGGFPDRSFHGEVDIVGGTMDERTRTVPLRIVLDNPGERLRPGMFGEARFSLAGAPRTLAVPTEAVLSDEGRDFVFVRHEGGDFVRRPVAVGRSRGGRVAIEADLAEGQEVATTGAFLLKSDVLREKMGAGCAD